jgi:hypothetical protein
MNTKVMMDIETLGVKPGYVVTSVGVVVSVPEEPDFYQLRMVLPVADQLRLGLKIDADTLAWCLEREEPTRALRASLAVQKNLTGLMEELRDWLRVWLVKPGAELWANGPDFDLRLLEVLFERTRVEVPWKYYQARCFRTWRTDKGLEKPANGHDALDDARRQLDMLVWGKVESGKRKGEMGNFEPQITRMGTDNEKDSHE